MDPYIGEIRIFGGNFAPRGWALCNGQILNIVQHTALFSLLGTTYGGNGQTTFALPNLQGRAPMHPGQGPGLSPHVLGEASGSSTITLLMSEIPSHNHQANASSNDVDSPLPGGNSWGAGTPSTVYRPDADTTMSSNALAIIGSSQPHNNMQPSLGLSFIIALQGIYPPRS
jgi:microcystin-dependent protein